MPYHNIMISKIYDDIYAHVTICGYNIDILPSPKTDVVSSPAIPYGTKMQLRELLSSVEVQTLLLLCEHLLLQNASKQCQQLGSLRSGQTLEVLKPWVKCCGHFQQCTVCFFLAFPHVQGEGLLELEYVAWVTL